MKKNLLLVLLIISSSIISDAQNIIEHTSINDKKISENYTPKKNNNKLGGGWFNYGKEIETLSIDFNSYGSVIHPDSTMIDGYIDDQTGDTTYYNISRHSRGQILDPTSVNFLNTGNAALFTVGEGFILDTIEFPYQYIRPQTQNPDKLIVQVYSTPGGINQGAFGAGGNFYHMGYDYMNNKGTNAFKTIEYDLTAADETHPDSVGYQQFVIDPPLNLPNGGIVGATYTFVPGNTYNSGDTLATFEATSIITNPRNSFVVLYMMDKDMATMNDPNADNYNQTVTSDIQYNNSSLGWNGTYYPGTGWTSGGNDILLHDNIWFHLTPIAPPPSNITNITSTDIKLYPNPAKDKITIVLNDLSNTTDIKITDITGRTVYTNQIVNENLEINIKDYISGVYFCEIKSSKNTERIKFVKTD